MSQNHARNPKDLTHAEEHAKNLQKEFYKNKTAGERLADIFTEFFGTIWFLYVNILFFVIWILWNLGFFGFFIFDPFPFGFLTMVVSLEAIFLSIIVLISQNRASEMADVRQELDLRVNIRAEEEITKILSILDEMHNHIGLGLPKDPQIKQMKKKTNIQKIEEDILKERAKE